jgi:hypothetical protein
MTNWPKAWIEAILGLCLQDSPPVYVITKEAAGYILDHLQKVGALREVPAPKEFLRCPKCAMTYEVGSFMALEGVPGKYIRHPVTKKEMCESVSIEQWMKVRGVVE